MIRVYKSSTAPSSLSNTKKYDGEDVKIQLFADHYCKCYLCERILETDFQIEHFKSQANNPEDTVDWNNLFLSCSYCNQKKKNNFDNLLHPSTIDIELEISQHIDFSKSKALFGIPANTSDKHIETVELPNRIFNGSGVSRNLKESNFFDHVKREINSFMALIINWQNTPNDETKAPIICSLEKDKEFLGLKYWIIADIPSLFAEFKDNINWNRSK